MTNILKKVSTITMTIAATALLAGCSTTCGGRHHMDGAKKHHRDYGTHQPVMVYEAEAVEVFSYVCTGELVTVIVALFNVIVWFSRSTVTFPLASG